MDDDQTKLESKPMIDIMQSMRAIQLYFNPIELTIICHSTVPQSTHSTAHGSSWIDGFGSNETTEWWWRIDEEALICKPNVIPQERVGELVQDFGGGANQKSTKVSKGRRRRSDHSYPNLIMICDLYA